MCTVKESVYNVLQAKDRSDQKVRCAISNTPFAALIGQLLREESPTRASHIAPGRYGSTPGKTSNPDRTHSSFNAGDLLGHTGVQSSRFRARLDAGEDFEVRGQLPFLFVRRVEKFFFLLPVRPLTFDHLAAVWARLTQRKTRQSCSGRG